MSELEEMPMEEPPEAEEVSLMDHKKAKVKQMAGTGETIKRKICQTRKNQRKRVTSAVKGGPEEMPLEESPRATEVSFEDHEKARVRLSGSIETAVQQRSPRLQGFTAESDLEEMPMDDPPSGKQVPLEDQEKASRRATRGQTCGASRKNTSRNRRRGLRGENSLITKQEEHRMKFMPGPRAGTHQHQPTTTLHYSTGPVHMGAIPESGTSAESDLQEFPSPGAFGIYPLGRSTSIGSYSHNGDTVMTPECSGFLPIPQRSSTAETRRTEPCSLAATSIVYADNTPMSIRERIRRRLCFLAFILVASIAVAFSLGLVLQGRSSNTVPETTMAPTAAPSTSPTFVSPEVLQYAALLSGEVVSDPESPQFKAMGWMSTFDTANPGFGEPFQQRYTLATLFYSLGGENWVKKDNWMVTELHECDWSVAIFCIMDGTGRRLVNGLDLIRNGLHGQIPEELRHMPYLEFLRLSENRINGKLTSAIFSLPSLSVLDLSNNEVTGSMPMGRKEMSLVFLDISHNQMTGSIPPSFYALILLRIYDASFNQLSGSISKELANLSVLNKFNVRSNHLTGAIPEFAEEHAGLELVDLSQNFLTGTIPSTWFSLSRQELVLRHNLLTGTLPSVSHVPPPQFVTDTSTQQNARIQKVDIAFNMLTGPVPLWIARVPSIQHIDISYNLCSGMLPGGENLWTGIETFRAAHNLLTGTVSQLPSNKVIEVDLQGNNLSGIFPLAIEDFERLKYLILNDNSDMEIKISPLLKSAVNLVVFRARNTNMTGSLNGTEWMSLSDSLRILDLSQSMLKGTIPTEMGRLSLLKELGLGTNNFTGRVPSEIGLLDGMIELQLNNNNLAGELPSELGQLGLLEVLALANNILTGNIPSELGQLKELQMFTLSGNDLLQGAIPNGLCTSETTISRAGVGCQLECNCCVDLTDPCPIQTP